MIEIDKKRAIELLEKAVEAKGADYILEEQCLYALDGVTGLQ